MRRTCGACAMWVRREDQIKCIMIRHGSTLSNQSGRYLGRREEDLTPEGVEDLMKRRSRIPSVDVCVVSPMSRCRQSASILWPGVEQIIIPQFTEIDFGKWDGKNYLELSGDPLYQNWIDSNGELPFPEGEDKAGFIRRILEGYQCFLQKRQELFILNRASSIGFLVHGGTIMALLSSLLDGGYYSYQVANGCGYQFFLDPHTGRIGKVEKLDD